MAKLILFLMVLAAAAGGGAVATGVVANPVQTNTSPPPRAPQSGPRAAAPATAPSPAPGEMSVTVDEATLTQQLNERFAGQSLGNTPLGPAVAKRMEAKLANGQMTISGDAQVAAATVPISTTGRVAAQNGRAVVTVTEAKVGGVPLPDSVTQSLQSSLQGQVDQLMQRQGLRASSITIADGKLVAIGSRA